MGRGRPHKCPYCGATKNVAKGFRRNKTGVVRLRRCLACRRRWTAGPKLEDGKRADFSETAKVPGGVVSSTPNSGPEHIPGQKNDEESAELPLGRMVGPSRGDSGRGEEKTEENAPDTE